MAKSPLQERAVSAAPVDVADQLPESWPQTPDGRPWFRVTVGAEEKVGLENIGLKFSSITVGPVFITAFVPPGATSMFKDENEKVALTRVLEEAAVLLELDVAAPQRELGLESIKNSGALASALSS